MTVYALDGAHRGGAAVGCTVEADVGRLTGEISRVMISETYPTSAPPGSAVLSFLHRTAVECELSDDLRIGVTAEEEVNLDIFHSAVAMLALRSFGSTLNYKGDGYRLSISDALTWTFTGRFVEQKRTARLSWSGGEGPLTGTLRLSFETANRKRLQSEQSVVIRFSGELFSWTAELRRSRVSHESRVSLEVKAGNALWRFTLSTRKPLEAVVELRG